MTDDVYPPWAGGTFILLPLVIARNEVTKQSYQFQMLINATDIA
jgi:hypothetical protein